MARTKSGTPVRSDRLLMVLCNGGVVSLKEIENTMEYPNMYRISCEIYCIKLGGGIVKTHKEGRKVVAYELVNPQEMIDKYLTPYAGHEGVAGLAHLVASDALWRHDCLGACAGGGIGCGGCFGFGGDDQC